MVHVVSASPDDYINAGPGVERCDFAFLVDEQLNWAEASEPVRVFSTLGKRCGLPVDPNSSQGYCYWHKADPDKAKDPDIRQRLEKAIADRTYLGGTFLSGGGPGTQIAGSRGPLDLSGAKLDGAYFAGAYIEGTCLRKASLRQAHLQQAFLGSTNLAEADLTSAHLWGTDFQGARMAGVNLWDADINGNTRLDAVSWGTDYVLPPERQGRFDFAEATYRMLKQHRQNAGDYHAAGEFYFREMECIRKQLSGIRRLLWTLFYKSSCGYGERPTWTFAWAVAVIGVWGAILFPFLGIRNPDGTVSALGNSSPLETIGNGLSLSLITFATLGYGNRYPSSPLGEHLAGCEALLGILLSSLFVVSFAKKVIRG